MYLPVGGAKNVLSSLRFLRYTFFFALTNVKPAQLQAWFMKCYPTFLLSSLLSLTAMSAQADIIDGVTGNIQQVINDAYKPDNGRDYDDFRDKSWQRQMSGDRRRQYGNRRCQSEDRRYRPDDR